jgi:hypothetical protein
MPPLAEGSGASWVQENAWRSPDGEATLATGCVATPVPGWVEDMRPQVAARTVALAGAVAERAVGAPVDARSGGGEGVLVLRPVSDLEGPPVGSARTFVGFDGPSVVTCFAVCVAPSGAPACEDALRSARLERSTPPPPPGAGLRLVTAAVHHPTESAAALGGAILLAASLGIALRKKPRLRAR